MTIPIRPEEFSMIRRYIENQCGIRLGDDKTYLVENRLSHLVETSGCRSFGELCGRLRHPAKAGPLRDAVLDAIATNETLWFRDHHPFRILREDLLPGLMKEIEEGRRERIAVWSAACSTGQEPYSIAMVALEVYAAAGCEDECGRRVGITASDVSFKSLSAAKKGQYSEAAIQRGMSPRFLYRHFQKTGNKWEISDQIRSMVTFAQYNLKDAPPGTFGSFDMVFLRNAIIYFSDDFKRDLLEKVARLMSPRGILFLGTGETITGYTDAFEIVEDAGSIYYRLRP